MTYDSYFVIVPLKKTEVFQHLLYNLIAIYVSAMVRDRLVFQEKRKILQLFQVFAMGPTDLWIGLG